MGVLPQVNVKILVSEIARNASKTSNMITDKKAKIPFLFACKKVYFLGRGLMLLLNILRILTSELFLI